MSPFGKFRKGSTMELLSRFELLTSSLPRNG